MAKRINSMIMMIGLMAIIGILFTGNTAQAATRGLYLLENGTDTVVYVLDGSVIGEIELHEGETTGSLEVIWRDGSDMPFQPSGTGDSLNTVLSSTADLAENETGIWTFTISSTGGHGVYSATFSLYIGGTLDYTSPAIEVHVVEEHAEAEGLRIVDTAGDTLVWVNGSTVIGEIEAHHMEETDLLEVFFIDVNDSLFQPEHPDEFWLVGSIVDPLTAEISFLDSAAYTFKVTGVEEGMTDLTLSIYHDDHPDYTSPAIEVHVVEEHAEAEGLRIVDIAGDTLVWVNGSTVIGEIEAHHMEETDLLEVFFIDVNDSLFQPEHPDEFWLVGSIVDPLTAEISSLDSAAFTFKVTGVADGMTDLTLSIYHDDHPDYTSPAIEVHVVEEHAEAEGLRIVDTAGDTLVWVNGSTVIGEVKTKNTEETDLLEVFFIDINNDLFQPEHPDEFWLVGSIVDPLTAEISSLDSAAFTFKVTGVADGMTDLTLSIFHDDHADYTSPVVPVFVTCCDAPGDANSDNAINLLDILHLISNIYDDPPGPGNPNGCDELMDANGDHALDLLDILYLIAFIYDDPPGPAPVCPM